MDLKQIENVKKRFQASDDDCEKLLELLNMLSNKIRFRVLCLLRQGEFCVTEIVEIIQAGKISNVSQQLRLLTMSDVLTKRREKKKIYYTLKDKKIARLIEFLEKTFLNG